LAKTSRRSTAPLAEQAVDDPRLKRLMTITGIDMVSGLGLIATIGDHTRFASSEKLVSYLGLNPSVRQSGSGPARHGRITKRGANHARALLVEATKGGVAGSWSFALVLHAGDVTSRKPGRSRGDRKEAGRDHFGMSSIARRTMCSHVPVLLLGSADLSSFVLECRASGDDRASLQATIARKPERQSANAWKMPSAPTNGLSVAGGRLGPDPQPRRKLRPKGQSLGHRMVLARRTALKSTASGGPAPRASGLDRDGPSKKTRMGMPC
jgi:hypothetical protein